MGSKSKSHSCATEANNVGIEKQKIVLDYIISHLGKDQRPYLKVIIFGLQFFGLLDSGASRTIIGEDAYERLRNFNIVMNTCDSTAVTVANGESCPILGIIQIDESY